MKKFLSILLTLTMIFGLLAVVPVNAETTYIVNYTNDFESQALNGGTNAKLLSEIVAGGNNSDYAAMFTNDTGSTKSTSEFTPYSNGAALANSSNPVTFSAGSTVTASLDIKIPQALVYNGSSTTCYVQWVIGQTEGTHDSTNVGTKSRITFDGTKTNEWQSISQTFTVNSDFTVQGIKLRFGTTGAGNSLASDTDNFEGIVYYVDNIVFQVAAPATVEPEPEPEPEPEEPETDTTNYIVNYTNDFEAQTKIGAATSPLTMDVVTGGNNSSYAAKFTAGSGTTQNNAHFVPYVNGANIATSSNPVTFTAGSTLTTSLDIKLPQALVYNKTSSTCYVQWLIKYAKADGSGDAYVGTESRMSFDGSNTTSWQSLSATIDFDTDTVVKEIKLRFGTTGAANYLASNTSSSEGMEYLVDNIVFQVAAPAAATVTGTTLTATAADGATVVSADAITNATLIWVAYDANDKMVSHATAACNVTAGGTATVAIPQTFNAAGASKVKVMLWQDMTKCIPLADLVQY